MKPETLYIAYGSNLNLPQMSVRCPTAKVVGASEIKDYELLFRAAQNVPCDVEPLKGSSVPVLLWKLKERDCRPSTIMRGTLTFTERKSFLWSWGKNDLCMVYVMNDGIPSELRPIIT
jgi:hypothetical protein